jgi:hypothetical protein
MCVCILFVSTKAEPSTTFAATDVEFNSPRSRRRKLLQFREPLQQVKTNRVLAVHYFYSLMRQNLQKLSKQNIDISKMQSNSH